jgi:RNA polymerase sigma factor (sigma-70 family)
MARPHTSTVLRRIRILFQEESWSGLSDLQLLERFLAGHDEAAELAFTALVERHGPMVLGVCRRILGDPHDAEDAFQATFLILVRKARSIRVEGSVGRWLYGVARRVAARGKARTLRRESRETGCVEILVAPATIHPTDRDDLRAVLAQELGKLPSRYQMPVALCDLEGLTHEEAARRLNLPVGTVKSRLSRARSQLRSRLTRRGLTPSELFTLGTPARSVLPDALVDSTVRVAQHFLAGQAPTIGIIAVPARVAALTQGVLESMFLTKLKIATAALLIVVSSSLLLVHQATAQKPATEQGQAVKPTATVGTSAREKGPSDADLDVMMLERAWLDALGRRDKAVVDRILADDLVGINLAGNTFAKGTYLKEIEEGAYAPGPIEPIEIGVRSFGDAAVLSSRTWIKNVSPVIRFTKVYMKHQGRWQCVASHESQVQEPAAGSGGFGMMRGMMGRGTEAKGAQRGGMMSGYGGMMSQMMRGGYDARMRGKGDEMMGSMMPGGMMSGYGGMMSGSGGMMAMMGGKPRAQAARMTKIRPRFDCLVEKIHVQPGQTVKKGDPLAGLFSTELVVDHY